MKSVFKRLAVIGLVMLGMITMVQMATAMPAQTPEEIADACIVEMGMIRNAAQDALAQEYSDFESFALNVEPGTPAPPVFKEAAATAVRLDRISSSAIDRIYRVLNRCFQRIERLHGDESLEKVMAAPAQDFERDLRAELLNDQRDVAVQLRNYIAQLTL